MDSIGLTFSLISFVSQLLDFLSMSSVVRGKALGAEQGWYKIAWAFLKVKIFIVL